MADIINVYQVAEEMGNSPAMVKTLFPNGHKRFADIVHDISSFEFRKLSRGGDAGSRLLSHG